ncbi:hypothetical protein Emed_003576 [Eimeria media]
MVEGGEALALPACPVILEAPAATTAERGAAAFAGLWAPYLGLPTPFPVLRPEDTCAPPPLPHMGSQPLLLDGVDQEPPDDSGPAVVDSRADRSCGESVMAE